MTVKCIQCDQVIYTLNKKEYKKPAKVGTVVCGRCVQQRLRGRKFGFTDELRTKAKALHIEELLDSLTTAILNPSPDRQDRTG